MKSVLISIKPHWCELIANGKKTVEVRKTVPNLQTPFKCYIYCTKARPFIVWGDVFRGNWDIGITSLRGYSRKDAEKIWDIFNGKIMGEFICDKVFRIDVDFNIHYELPGNPIETWLIWEDAPDEYETTEDIEKASCLTIGEIGGYIGTGDGCYCWHISDLEIYDTPKELADLGLSKAPQSWSYVEG